MLDIFSAISSTLQHVDLLFVGVTVAAIGILGLIVFWSNKKSITGKTFLFFSLVTIAYGIVNYANYQVTSPIAILWLLRFTLFFAVLHAFSFFQLAFVFPLENQKISKWYKFLLIPEVILVAFITLTPLAFSGIEILATTAGQVSQAKTGPGMFLFGLSVLFFVIGGLILLFKKTVKATGIEKEQLVLFSIGTVITFFCLIIFNFVLPVVFSTLFFIPFAPVFILPLVVLTTYAIVKHHLLNVKVVTAGIAVFALSILSFFQIIFSQSMGEIVLRVSSFILILIFSMLFIKSILREVEQREKLQELSKAKSEFMSIASHQLRTPLTIMKGYVSMLEEGSYGEVNPKQKETLSKVFKTNEEMITMVNDLLNMTRAEEGRLQYSFENADLRKLVQNAVKNLELVAKEKGIALEEHIPQTPVLVSADKDKLTQVVSNLIDNAIKYTEKGSIKVTLVIDETNKTATITVVDTGLGIEKEEMDHLFQSFSRGKAGSKLWNKGAGMGLYIAKQFVQAHRGKIWAESAGKDQGSTFFVELHLT